MIINLRNATMAVDDKLLVADGGEVVEGDGFVYAKFLSSGRLVVREPCVARILAVGGGGAGGTSPDTTNGAGGGGGAGGFCELADYSLAAGEYVVTVGAGGARADITVTPVPTLEGNDGGPSSIVGANGEEVVYVYGGGGGGAASVGHDGGSGGGGSRGSSQYNGGSPIVSTQGFAGGRGNGAKYGAGGGGAGGAGGAGSSVSRTGGDGVVSDITGEAAGYAAGGGGGRSSGKSLTRGGAGLPGEYIGGFGGSTDVTSTINGGPGQEATAGVPNTGSGGGGGGGGGVECTPYGGAGADGIVIVRVDLNSQDDI